jgi:hypothetical protein
MAAPTTTYKQTVKLFEQIALSQQAVKQFQVGQFSDLDIETDVNPFQRFPLVFMVPRTSSLDRFGKMVLGFSMVVCDIAKDNVEDLQVNTLNSTLMIFQDIASKIIMTTAMQVDIDLETPINVTPFQERYNNNLTGWTAELNVIVSSPFNLCDAAFES